MCESQADEGGAADPTRALARFVRVSRDHRSASPFSRSGIPLAPRRQMQTMTVYSALLVLASASLSLLACGADPQELASSTAARSESVTRNAGSRTQCTARRRAPQRTSTTTYQAYNPADGQMDLTQNITYVLPNPTQFGPGPYPVFIWVPGTDEPYNDRNAKEFTQQMALRGFLSASVQYSNTEAVQDCNAYQPRAQGIFDSTRSDSAVGVLCNLCDVDCTLGITVSGVSQGAELAVLSANYSPQVQAVYALSGGDHFEDVNIPLPCMDKANTMIPGNRLTIIDGQSDPFFGGQSNVQNVSGFVCPDGSFQCWSPDDSGAGWYIVQDWQNTTGVAGHCYFTDSSSVDVCSGGYDVNWRPPATYDWSLDTNLDWLASLGTYRNFSPTGY
jgi:hypothetical protein